MSCQCRNLIITLTVIHFLTFLVLTPITALCSDVSFSDNLNPAFQVKSSSPASIQFQFTLPDIDRQSVMISGERFDEFRIAGEICTESGELHELPTIVRLVQIPPQSGVELRISNLTTSIQTNVYLNISNIKNEDNFLHQEIAKLGKPAIMRGHRLVPLIINPLHYNPATHELEIVESIDIELDFASNLNRVNIIENPERARPSRYIDRLLSNLVVNPSPERDDPELGGSIVYIIGDWDDVEAEIEPLVEWRRRKGWTVEVFRMPRMTRFTLRTALVDAYQEWDVPPEFVVLVGDAPGLDGNRYTIPYWNEQNGARVAYETDHHYCELEGDDVLPEAAIGRLVFNSIPMLRNHVEKIVNYESDPVIGRDWQIKAITAATDYRSGMSSIDMCRWFSSLASRHGFSQVNELYWSNDNRDPNPTNFITTNINSGVSFFLYRGWNNMNGFDPAEVNRLRNGRMLPFVVLATCHTGHYGPIIQDIWSYTERFSYHNGGAIGAVGAAGATHTAYNNILATTIMYTPFVREVYSQGWALMAGKLALYLHYANRNDIQHAENRGMEAWLTELYIYNLMGDPAVDLFTAVPRQLVVNHPDEIRIGESLFEVTVDWEDEEAPAEGLQVCLYRPDTFQSVVRTNAEGIATFNLEPDWTQEEGEIQLTITGPNVRSYLVDIEVDWAETFIVANNFAVDDDREGESRGDNDHIANPLERIELDVELTNCGEHQPQGQLTVGLTALHPQILVVEDEFVINSAPRPGRTVTAHFVFDIRGGFPNEEDAVFLVEASANNQSWTSSITIPVEGPQLELDFMEWEDTPMLPGDTCDVWLFLENVGSKATSELDARLIRLTQTIGVLNDETTFDPIPAGQIRQSNGMLRVRAHQFHLRGTRAEFALALEGDGGFLDTAYFSYKVDRVRAREPFGPDEYGYICLDNTDTSWASYPRFDWIEIDTRFDDPDRGTNTNLRDRGEEDDASVLIELPFEFVYYGESFDEVTICTNGWIALGDHHEMISARNRRIPGGEVSPAMICPFWEDLITQRNDGGIYYWYDEERHRFIIEWSRLRKLGPEGGREPLESFEVILYDPEHHLTRSGDGDIVFQYLLVTDNRSCYQDWDTPYATVGISSPDQSTGLEYSFGGDLHVGAASLVPRRAIKFTTMIEYSTAIVTGRVIDADTEAPLSGVQVSTSYGTLALTDENGDYNIEDAIIADDYTFKASKEFYNDSTLTGISIVSIRENIVDFALLHPEFSVNPRNLELEAVYVDSLSEEIVIENEGNGMLNYRSRLINLHEQRRDDPDETWDILLEWAVGDTTNDNCIQGIVHCENHWIVAGGANGDDENWFYRFGNNGCYLNRVYQPVDTRYGIRDMEYHAGAIYCVYATQELLKIDIETGRILRYWHLPELLNMARAIAIDPEHNCLFISGSNPGIYEFCFDEDSTLVWLDRHEIFDPRTDSSVKPYGMGWFPDDEDGCPLYLYTKDEPERNYNLPDISIYKVEPKSCSIRFVTDLPFLDPHIAGRAGMCITPDFNCRYWALAAVLDKNDGDDRIAVFELAPNFKWICYSPRDDILTAGETREIGIVFHTEYLENGRYEIALEFTHNAHPGVTQMPILLDVIVSAPQEESSEIPGRYALEQNWPNPFNPETVIAYRLPRAGRVHLQVIDINGRIVTTLVDEVQTEGAYHVRFDAASLPAGIYFYQITAGEFSGVRKMVLVR